MTKMKLYKLYKCPVCFNNDSTIDNISEERFEYKYSEKELLQHLLDHNKDDLIKYVYEGTQ